MGRREWDSTNKNLSGMTYSPKERLLKKEASVKATQALRTASPRANNDKKETVIKDKQVNWKEWNLREAVDFESEIVNFVPVKQVASYNSPSVYSSPSSVNLVNDQPSEALKLDGAQKNAIRHLKNVLSNSISENTESTKLSSDNIENLQMNTDTSALIIKYILESKNKELKRDGEISELKEKVLKLQKEVDEGKDDLDACQLIVSNHQRRIQELEIVVESQHVIIKDQANLLVDHMSSKEVLENIRKSMSGIRF